VRPAIVKISNKPKDSTPIGLAQPAPTESGKSICRGALSGLSIVKISNKPKDSRPIGLVQPAPTESGKSICRSALSAPGDS